MKKNIKFIILLVIMLLGSFSIISFASEGGKDISPYLSMDYENLDKLPDNFRKTSDISKVIEGKVNTEGLEELNISGSAQFTSLSLINLKNNINTKYELWDIDLRQESHGFINGNAVSWFEPGDKANAGLPYTTVLEKEAAQLSSIPFGQNLILNNGKHTLFPTVIENESKLVSSNKLKYLRIAVTDDERPTDESVDQFIHFVNSLPDKYWLHFHCKAGDGRTTTFMAMFDMMHNSKKVSFEDIMNRQFLLGGENLIIPNKMMTRQEFLKNFYNYTKENTNNYSSNWSEYITKNNIPPYNLSSELPKH